MKELRILAVVLACLCIFVVVGCSDSSSEEQQTQPAEPGGPVPEGN